MSNNCAGITNNLLLTLANFGKQSGLAKDFSMNRKGNRIHFRGDLKKSIFTFYVILDPLNKSISLTGKWKSPSQKDSPYGYSGLFKIVHDLCKKHYEEVKFEEDKEFGSKRKNNSFFQVSSSFFW